MVNRLTAKVYATEDLCVAIDFYLDGERVAYRRTSHSCDTPERAMTKLDEVKEAFGVLAIEEEMVPVGDR